MDATDVFAEDWDPAEALAGDTGGQVLRGVLEALRARRATLKKTMDQGLAPDAFNRATALLNGFDAAERGLNLAWERRHGRTR